MPVRQFSGSLLSKRKADLVEIAEALGISETAVNMPELRERIQVSLNDHVEQLKDDPRFSGLYKGRGRFQCVRCGSPKGGRTLRIGTTIRN